MANRLVELGYTPAIITRGYKRKSKGQVVVCDGNGPIVSPIEGGDEPYLMAQKTNNVVIIADKNRYEAGKTAHQKYGCNIIIIDDGFQHRRLFRNINIVLWDSYSSPFREKILPFGKLRESFTGLKRADFVVLTRTENSNEDYINFFKNNNLECFTSSTLITGVFNQSTIFDEKKLKRKNILAFCGLGNHEQFYDTVKLLEPSKIITANFSDHNKYSSIQMEKLFEKAKDANCNYLITTEKDYTNIPVEYKKSEKLIVISISLEINNTLIEKILNGRMSNE